MKKLFLILLLIPTLAFAEPRTSNNLTDETWYGAQYGAGEPAKGGYITDTNTGNTVYRITETTEATQLGGSNAATSQRNSYSRFTPVNSDGNKLMATSGDNGFWIWDLSVDPPTVISQITNKFAGSDDRISSGNDPRWDYSGDYPKRIYWHHGMALYQADYDAFEATTELVHDFTDDVTGVSRLTTYDWTDSVAVTMDAEGDPSNDSRYWTFYVRDAYNSAIGAYPTNVLITYDKQTDTVLGTLEAEDIHNVASGTYINTPNMVETSPDGTRVMWNNNGTDYSVEFLRLRMNDNAANTTAINDCVLATCVDLATSANTSTITTTGVIDGGFAFTGTEYIDGDALAATISNDQRDSFMFWIKPTDGVDGTIISIGDADGNSAFVMSQVDTNDKISVQLIKAGTTQWAATSPDNSITAGSWHHVTFQVNSLGTISMYIDGATVTLTFSDSTDKTQWMGDLTGIDTFRIGCLNYNSSGNATFGQFVMDDFKMGYGDSNGNMWNLSYEFTAYNKGNGDETLWGYDYLSVPHVFPIDLSFSTYDTGTVEVTNGSPTVTVTDGNFTTGSVSAGMYFQVRKRYASDWTNTEQRWYEIQSKDSDTQITLTENFEGTTGSDLVYNIHTTPVARMVPDGAHSGWAWDSDTQPVFVWQNNKNDYLQWSDYLGRWFVNGYYGDLDWQTGWHWMKVYDTGKKGWACATTSGPDDGTDWANNMLYCVELKESNPTYYTISPQYGYIGSYSREQHCSLDLSGNQVYCGWDWGVDADSALEVYRIKMPLEWQGTTNVDYLYDTTSTMTFSNVTLSNVTIE